MKSAKLFVIGAAAAGLVALGLGAIALREDKYISVGADPVEYYAIFNRVNIAYDAFEGKQYVTTSQGNPIYCYVGNGEYLDEGANFYSLRGNGSAVYFTTPFQHILDVKVSFSYSDNYASNALNIFFGASSGEYENKVDITGMSSYTVIPPVADNRYITIDYKSDSTEKLVRISSIEIHYTCA